MVLLGSLFLLAGLGLLAIGIRGKLIDDHTYCRRCRFDLTGRWPEARACPECGAELRLWTITHDKRKLHLLATVTGAAMTTIVVAWLALLVWGANNGANMNHYKPLWLLERELRDGDLGAVAEILTEVNRRCADKSISDEEITPFIAIILEWQADDAHDWRPEWGDFIEARRADSKAIGGDLWQQYLREGIELSFEVRPRIREGDKLPYRVSPAPTRLGSDRDVRVVVESIEVRESSSRFADSPSLWAATLGLSQHSGLLTIEPPPGKYKATISTTMELFPWVGGAGVNYRQDEFDVDLTVVGSGEDSVIPFAGDPLDDVLRSIIGVVASTSQSREGESYKHVRVDLGTLPVDVAFDVLIRRDGEEWRARTFIHRRNDGSASIHTGHSIPGEAGDRFEIILRSNAQAARESLDIVDYWEGELVFEVRPPKRPERDQTTLDRTSITLERPSVKSPPASEPDEGDE